jgi:hypothetical protein
MGQAIWNAYRWEYKQLTFTDEVLNGAYAHPAGGHR